MDSAIVDPQFDEEWYLAAYPDVAEAFLKGDGLSPYEHYVLHGQSEGRRPGPGFDAEWYARAYPAAVRDVGSAEPAALEEHYKTYGHARGYLPERLSRRKQNSAAISSPFGGLWVDLANAQDLVTGKYEIGLLTRDDKARLEEFIRDGYVILRNAVPPMILDRAEEALETAYAGGVPDLKFECHAVAREQIAWHEGVRDNPSKALDFHWFSREIRDLIFCDPLTHFLHLIFERPAMASQTLGFFRGSGQPLHQDSAYVAYSLPLQFAASWIALEDVQPGGGELEYLVGSHRKLPEFLYPGGAKNVSESRRLKTDPGVISDEVRRHERGIQTDGQRLELSREKFNAKRGDILIWHADLAHGGSPISFKSTRKSVVTHYCPWEVVPLYFEGGHPKSAIAHDRTSYYTSGVYERTAERE